MSSILFITSMFTIVSMTAIMFTKTTMSSLNLTPTEIVLIMSRVFPISMVMTFTFISVFTMTTMSSFNITSVTMEKVIVTAASPMMVMCMEMTCWFTMVTLSPVSVVLTKVVVVTMWILWVVLCRPPNLMLQSELSWGGSYYSCHVYCYFQKKYLHQSVNLNTITTCVSLFENRSLQVNQHHKPYSTSFQHQQHSYEQ